MSCEHCAGIEEMFDGDHAEDELEHYRKRGPRRTTRMLIKELLALGVQGQSVLDVGGGIGAVHLALLKAGAREATEVEASGAFLKAAEREAGRRRLHGRVTYVHGNFVEVAPSVAPADVVALDKVVCCYADAVSLLDASAERARSVLGLVYPRDGWMSRLVNWAFNLRWIRSADGFRTYVHSRAAVEKAVRSRGLQLVRRVTVGLWQVVVFSRSR